MFWRTAYTASVCLIGTVLPNGFAQITSSMVFDDEHIALWKRGKGTTTENLRDGDLGIKLDQVDGYRNCRRSPRSAVVVCPRLFPKSSPK
jgi:hypothetical protein